MELSDQKNGIAPGNYVFAAHDNSTGVVAYTDQNGNTGERWNRVWKVEETGKLKSTFIMTFNLDAYFGTNSTNPTTGTKNDYQLLESPSPSFTPSTTTSIKSGQKVTLTSNTIAFLLKYTKLTPNSYYTLATDNPTGSPLPVEWQYFEGEANGQQNLLKWGTASETNARHFEVQRASLTNKDFQAIATMRAAGTTIEPQDYTYTDAISGRQTHYYRLKQVDFDGSYEYSNVIALGKRVKQAEAQLRLTQNPVRLGQPIRYQFENAGEQPVVVRLIDVRGQQRYQQRVSAQEGAQALRPGNLSPGGYWLQIQSAKQSFSRKVVIY